MQYYAVSFDKMQDNLAEKLVDLRSYRQQKGLSQADLAQELGISQATVSRRERKPPQRHSDATYKLCSYAITATGAVVTPDRQAIQISFDEIWDKSDAHAAALTKIVEAVSELSQLDRRNK